jgi:hypothetical protein
MESGISTDLNFASASTLLWYDLPTFLFLGFGGHTASKIVLPLSFILLLGSNPNRHHIFFHAVMLLCKHLLVAEKRVIPTPLLRFCPIPDPMMSPMLWLGRALNGLP